MDILPSNTPQNKTCTKCKQPFPATLEFFGPDKKGKYGLHSRCRPCERICQKERQKKYLSKPEVREQRRAYCQEWHSRPEVKAQQHDYYQRPEVKARMQELHKGYSQLPKYQEYAKAYHQRPETKARMNAFYATPVQKERRRIYHQEYVKRVDTQQRLKAYQQHYYSLPEVQQHRRAWHQAYWKRPGTRSLYQANRHQRRARLKEAQGEHTPEQIREQYERQKGKCYYCQNKVALNAYHIDHVIPLSREGSNDISNLVIACPRCNLSKHNKLPHEFWQGGRLL